MNFTFFWATLYVIVRPILDLLFKDPIVNMGSQQLVMSMLSFYLLWYYLLKSIR